MNTQRTAARRLDKEISNGGAPPRGNQVPPLEEVANDDQAPVNLPSLTDRALPFSKWPKPILLKNKP